jgi:hypothetical protein
MFYWWNFDRKGQSFCTIMCTQVAMIRWCWMLRSQWTLLVIVELFQHAISVYQHRFDQSTSWIQVSVVNAQLTCSACIYDAEKLCSDVWGVGLLYRALKASLDTVYPSHVTLPSCQYLCTHSTGIGLAIYYKLCYFEEIYKFSITWSLSQVLEWFMSSSSRSQEQKTCPPSQPTSIRKSAKLWGSEVP